MTDLPSPIDDVLRIHRQSFITAEFAEMCGLDPQAEYTLDGDRVGVGHDMARMGYVLAVLDEAYRARAVAQLRAALEEAAP